MHSQARFEVSHVPVPTPVSDVGSLCLDTDGRKGQSKAVWVDLPDDEIEAVS